MSLSRPASHAGSWYQRNTVDLNNSLTEYLSNAAIHDAAKNYSVKAIIAPHAGYTYSGRTAGFGYKQINPNNIETVFILGPSHYFPMNYCGLTQFSEYKTPIGTLMINSDGIFILLFK
ncbi:hypothetical protein GJ496_004513 [Pomphorhynchus laevis]|nr:hypothetical protein GJ496_004513 [Pomphorhynchus laevis]